MAPEEFVKGAEIEWNCGFGRSDRGILVEPIDDVLVLVRFYGDEAAMSIFWKNCTLVTPKIVEGVIYDEKWAIAYLKERGYTVSKTF